MALYRFRITFEDYEEVSRDIEIKSIQTFEDLHHAIMKAVEFDGSQMASFYMSDDYWRKGQEITLMDMSESENTSIPTMKNSVLRDFISDPHQKIYYVFDFLTMWAFKIELFKIIREEEYGAEYPRVVKSTGDAPKQYTGMNPVVVPGDDEMDEEVISELDEDEEEQEEKEILTYSDEDGSGDGFSEIETTDEEPRESFD